MHHYEIEIKNGKLSLDIPGLKDGQYSITIKKVTQQRTLPQLRYLWSVVYAYIADFTGHTKEEIHEAMKLQFLRDVLEVPGKTCMLMVPYVRSLSDLGDVDISEMINYIEQVKAWAATELGLIIPDPGIHE
jgi:hypothetical protein